MADRIIKSDSGNDVVIQNNDASRKIEVTNSGDVEVTGDFKATTVKATNLKANDGTASLVIADSTGQVTSSGKIDLNGNELILDADADTSITADTDDQIDIKIGGTDKARIESSGIRLLGTDADTSSQVLFNDTGGEEWGIQYDAGALKFSESGVATQVTMSDGGNFGIQTSSPANDLEIGAYSGDKTLCLTSSANGNTFIRMNDGDSSEGMFIKTTGGGTAAATSMNFGVRFGSDSTKLTLLGDGKCGIGTESPTGTLECKGTIDQTLRVHCDTSSNVQAMVIKHGRANTASASMIVFVDAANGDSGIITSDGTSTSYGTSSDYRKKENVIPLTDAINRLTQLKPSRFNFIDHPNKTVDGFIAHEVQEIVPEAVIGEKDAMKSEGVPNYQMMDTSYLVPLVVGALQEAIKRIETLENS